VSIFEVQHQPIAHALVQQALLNGRLGHGLLLAGPGGVGKEMFADRLAALLLCDEPIEAPDGPSRAGLDRADLPDGFAPPEGAPWRDACGRCNGCLSARDGNHPDIHTVYRELHRLIAELQGRQGLELYIDVVRRFLIEPAARKSYRGRGKVFIVRDAHLMNAEAQNALLKTLEEPPDRTWLILLTDQAHRLTETVRSRCQLLRFAPLPTEYIRERLKGAEIDGRTVDATEANYLAARCTGRLGQALRLAEADLFGIHQDLAARLAQLKPTTAIDLADWFEEAINQLAKEFAERDNVTDSQAKKDTACELLATASLILADALRTSADARTDAPALFADAADKLAEGADAADRQGRLARGIEAVARADHLIATRFVNLRLALDEASLELADALAG